MSTKTDKPQPCAFAYLGFTNRQVWNIYAHCEPECEGWDCKYNDHDEDCPVYAMEHSDEEFVSSEQVRAVLTSAVKMGFIKIVPDKWCEEQKFDPQI